VSHQSKRECYYIQRRPLCFVGFRVLMVVVDVKLQISAEKFRNGQLVDAHRPSLGISTTHTCRISLLSPPSSKTSRQILSTIANHISPIWVVFTATERVSRPPPSHTAATLQHGSRPPPTKSLTKSASLQRRALHHHRLVLSSVIRMELPRSRSLPVCFPSEIHKLHVYRGLTIE
jgi:hypothetical protein